MLAGIGCYLDTSYWTTVTPRSGASPQFCTEPSDRGGRLCRSGVTSILVDDSMTFPILPTIHESSGKGKSFHSIDESSGIFQTIHQSSAVPDFSRRLINRRPFQIIPDDSRIVWTIGSLVSMCACIVPSHLASLPSTGRT